MSEFDRMSLNTEFNDDFYAPFVKESLVKLGMKHSESIPLPNGCTFIIGTVELIIVPDDAMNIEGQLDLSSYYCTGISGLNTYYGLRRLDSFPYVRVNEIPDF
jgi:flavin reductase (DIM6/NTAB) family NADH-FMN oxidoreductase RutF